MSSLPDNILSDGPNARAVARAVRVAVPPVVDGRLDDAAWKEAIPIDKFTQRVPREAAPSSERTEAWILYDDKNLYIGVRSHDEEAGAVWAKGMVRDDLALGDDAIAVLLDPYHDHRGGYLFAVSAYGGKTDGQLLGQSREEGYNIDWNGYWIGKSSRDATGWSAEYAIPFKTLRFKASQSAVWSMIIRRHINRKNEESYWPFINRSGSIYRPADAGHLVGIDGVRPGKNFEMKPYTLSGIRRMRPVPAGRLAGDVEAGGDVKVGITSGLTLDTSFNTDFAQIEADEQQINLSRFSLFYPEKRDFFLENSRVFDFGIARETQVFFSRRIGLSDSGQEIPLVYGAKLTGKVGKYGVGLLNVRSQAAEDRSADTSSVVRIRRDLFGNSKIGMIFTDRQTAATSNTVVGADLNLLLRRYFQVAAFAAKSDTPGRRGEDASWHVSAGWDSDRWLLRGSRLDVQTNFNPEVGFVRRRALREQLGEVRFSPRPQVPGLRRLSVLSTIRYTEGQRGGLESRQRWAGVQAELDSGDKFTAGVTDWYESLNTPLRLARDVTAVAGEHQWQEWMFQLEPYRARKWLPGVAVRTGGLYGWDRTAVEIDGGYRPTRSWGFGLKGALNFLSLDGRFVRAQALTTRVEYSFSPELYVRSLIQWNSDTRALNTNIRLHLLFSRDSSFFLVYNETTDANGARPVSRDRALVAKLSYLLRF